MAIKMSAADTLAWTQVVMTLISVGATTFARVKAALVDAGWAEDDTRLLALQVEYDRRIARRKAESE